MPIWKKYKLNSSYKYKQYNHIACGDKIFLYFGMNNSSFNLANPNKCRKYKEQKNNYIA